VKQSFERLRTREAFPVILLLGIDPPDEYAPRSAEALWTGAVLIVAERRLEFVEVPNRNNFPTLIWRRHFEQADERLESPGIDIEIERRQVCVAVTEPSANHADRCIDEVNLNRGSRSVRQINIPDAVLAQKESVIENHINAAPKKLRCCVPNQRATREDSPCVLVMADRTDRVPPEQGDQPTVKRKNDAVPIRAKPERVCCFA
jgi:hypothetical protein